MRRLLKELLVGAVCMLVGWLTVLFFGTNTITLLPMFCGGMIYGGMIYKGYIDSGR